MKIIKRDGKEVRFDSEKIFIAIQKANNAGIGSPELSEVRVGNVTTAVTNAIIDMGHTATVEFKNMLH